MRCYTVSAFDVTPSIAISPHPYPHIAVGEDGRGRTLARFPVGRRFAEGLAYQASCPRRGGMGANLWSKSSCPLCGVAGTPDGNFFRHPDQGNVTLYRPVERASVLKSKERGTLLLVEEANSCDRRALVLADIQAGFRGYTEWTGARYGELPCPNRGTEMTPTWEDGCPRCGVPCPSASGYRHPDAGVITDWEQFPPNGITVLARGYKAQGDAGRMGGHNVRLLVMEPGAAFRVHCGGRLYGAPAERFILWDGKNLVLGTQDEVWPPSCETPEGELI